MKCRIHERSQKLWNKKTSAAGSLQCSLNVSISIVWNDFWTQRLTYLSSDNSVVILTLRNNQMWNYD